MNMVKVRIEWEKLSETQYQYINIIQNFATLITLII